MKTKKLIYKRWGAIVLFIVLCLAIWFYFFQGFGRINFDEEKYIKSSLSSRGYEVIDVELKDSSTYVEMSASGTNTNYDLKTNFNWTWQVWNGFNTVANAYEVDIYDIEEMPKQELRELGIDPSEVPYMSDEELAEASGIVGKRASTYIIKMHTPQEVCSYRLSRTTYQAWSKASEICISCDISDSLSAKMDNEIKNSENCS